VVVCEDLKVPYVRLDPTTNPSARVDSALGIELA
jgi:hypothetical protein